ncbi:MAG: multicopper oxidase domain-containing protein [Pseudomonadales bacterium]|jgi:FtsP/CotA-like multicopper oxidase with cupredoxin domain
MRWLALIALLGAVLLYPSQWLPKGVRLQLSNVLGTPEYRRLPKSTPVGSVEPEVFCPEDLLGWRAAQTIDGVEIRRSPGCVADNPHAVAAVVRGTNNVSQQTLLASGLTPDAVEKGADLDGDGDPDEIHIRLEVVELNGGSPELDKPTTQFAIAPGIRPGFWVFAPKLFGMATENFESLKARPMLRLPSPAIRIEQGDRVRITLENTHYMPHTIHFHGVDHPFLDANGEGNDGVPITSETPVMPGAARTYELQPRQSGTMFYHCHVQPQVHIMMGLQGLFVVEENRPNNWLQTLNIGAGHVRVPSAAVREEFDREYDLQYLDIDKELNTIVQRYNDPRNIIEQMHRRYDITDARSDYFTLNGRSFPYTFRESLVVTRPDERVKLRIVNGGSTGIALHTHGHKATVTHFDGIAVSPAAQITRDVVWIASAQRVDLALQTTDDGLHSYGSGVWLMHDHQEKGVTTDGIGPGGNLAAIVYERFMGENGWPTMFGVDWSPYFTEAYYNRELPVWQAYDPLGMFASPGTDGWRLLRLLGAALLGGAALAGGVIWLTRRRRTS